MNANKDLSSKSSNDHNNSGRNSSSPRSHSNWILVKAKDWEGRQITIARSIVNPLQCLGWNPTYVAFDWPIDE